MHTFGIINAFICINNHVNSCINSMLSITSEIGGMSFTRSLLDTGASINILPKAVFDPHYVGELHPFLVELYLADVSVRKPHGLVEDLIVSIEDCYSR